jgi:hypothetical protein
LWNCTSPRNRKVQVFASADESQVSASLGRNSAGVIANVPLSGATSVSKIWQQAQLSAPNVVADGLSVATARAARAITSVFLAAARAGAAASAAAAVGSCSNVRRLSMIIATHYQRPWGQYQCTSTHGWRTDAALGVAAKARGFTTRASCGHIC